jgi:hypothetical protein
MYEKLLKMGSQLFQELETFDEAIMRQNAQETPFNIMNGRISNIDGENKLKIFDEQSNKNNSNFIQNGAMFHSQSPTCLSGLFFSSENIEALQLGLKNMILNKSNGKYNISRQSDTELKIIMRSIYIQYAKHNSVNILGQVKELNSLVLHWAVPRIMSNIQQQEFYIKDISTLPVPLENAKIMSKKGMGERQLELTKMI